jgi:hypothetical protein
MVWGTTYRMDHGGSLMSHPSWFTYCDCLFEDYVVTGSCGWGIEDYESDDWSLQSLATHAMRNDGCLVAGPNARVFTDYWTCWLTIDL